LPLQKLDLSEEYRSDRHNLIDDFYIPCLAQSTLYCRAVGFFSSSSLVSLSKGLTALIRGGGKMRLIASPHLSKEDIDAITQGLQKREEIISKSLLSVLEIDLDEITKNRFSCLAWLLSQGVLEIKLAIPKNLANFGLYHEKLGLFIDAFDNVIAFTGSANESHTSLNDNFECIDIFRSWQPQEQLRVQRKIDNFEKLWHNQTPHLYVLDFPVAAAQSLLKFRPNFPPTTEPDSIRKKPLKVAADSRKYQPSYPLKITPKLRQIEAINAWKKAKYQGILAMATGAGKTITALAAASGLSQLELIIIGVPSKELVQQWVKELNCRTTFAFPVIAMGDSRPWREVLFRKLRLINYQELPSQRYPVIVVGTYNELAKKIVSDLIADAGGLPKESLLIADEVHATGAGVYQHILRDDFSYRLGLSATPIRAYDELGTEKVLDYFGGIVYEYGLELAIQEGVLCEYDYYVYVTYLAEEEQKKYRHLTAKIARLSAQEEQQPVKYLLIQRAQLIKAAGAKLAIIDRILAEHLLQQTLIYCADIAQATAISARLAQQGKRVARYSSFDSERAMLLSQLSSGNLDALVAIKCLDEGVDIPQVSQGIILASDASPRQFIQRRGRILRAAAGKGKAILIDVLVVPPWGDGEVKLIESEIKRVIDFARSAKNQENVITMLVKELSYYGLTHSDLL
jgi:superfamily II DNA or RNA helicase